MSEHTQENEKTKVLIVDDSDNIRLFVNNILARNEYEVLEAKNGAEALRIFNSSRDISLILLDVMMPYMDGFEFLKQLPKKFPKSTPKICMITAKGAAKDVKKAVNLGAHDYIVKVIDKDILLNKVEALLGKNNSPEEFSTVQTYLEAQIIDFPIEHELEIIELSEAQATLRTNLKLKDRSNFTLRIPGLDDSLEEEVELCFRVIVEVNSDKPEYNIFKTNILGLDELTQNKLREITIKGVPFDSEGPDHNETDEAENLEKINT